jgi:hypothetical protein
MSWERDPLYAKAKLFFERAFEETRDDPKFGLWCSLGLELLARAALASISPTLLAEPDREHKYLLHALNRGSELTSRKSVGSIQVFTLCRKLFPKFTEEDFKAALALINRRNEELHSGAAAFDEYRPSQWLASFYRACHSLSSVLGETLENLFGIEEANVATEILKSSLNDVNQRVKSSIGAHDKVFHNKTDEEQKALAAKAVALGTELAIQRHHRVICPACKSVATVQGRPFGKEHITLGDTEIIVRQAVSPTSFSCSACGLKLEGYAELEVAGLGGQYTRRTTYLPEEYYGLVDPDDLDSYFEDYYGGPEYDNE